MKKKIAERAAETWGIPKDIMMNIPRLTISGDREIYIENHKGVALYTDSEIKISTASGAVSIYGEELVISVIRPEDILINGRFLKIEYENSKKR